MGLLRERDFRLIFLSFSLSEVGDHLALVALTIRAHDLTGSGWAVSGLLLTELVPLVLLAPFVGLLVDRVETVKVLRATAFLQAGVAASLAFVDSFPLILALSFLLGTGFAITRPAVFALVPKVAGEDRTTRANALLEAGRWGGATLGPIAAGTLAQTLGVGAALLADAGTFVVVLWAAVALRVRRAPEPQHSGEGAGAAGGDGAAQGFAFLAGDPLLRLVVFALGAMVVFTAIDNVAEVFFAKQVLDAGNVGFGVLVTSWGLGMVVGATGIAGRLSPQALAPAVLGAALLGGGAIALAAAVPVFSLAVPMFFAGGVANGIEVVAVRSLIHHRVPDRLRGRVFSAYTAIVHTGGILALGLGGALVEGVGIRGSLLVAGTGGAVVGLIGFFAFAGVREASDRAPE